VDHVHLVHNVEQDKHSGLAAKLHSFTLSGFLTLLQDASKPIQNPAYWRCFSSTGGNTTGLLLLTPTSSL
jgi:hypothetical protein